MLLFSVACGWGQDTCFSMKHLLAEHASQKNIRFVMCICVRMCASAGQLFELLLEESVCVCGWFHRSTFLCLCVRLWVCVWIYVCLFACVYVRLWVSVCVCIHVCGCALPAPCVCVCVLACTSRCVCVCSPRGHAGAIDSSSHSHWGSVPMLIPSDGPHMSVRADQPFYGDINEPSG